MSVLLACSRWAASLLFMTSAAVVVAKGSFPANNSRAASSEADVANVQPTAGLSGILLMKENDGLVGASAHSVALYVNDKLQERVLSGATGEFRPAGVYATPFGIESSGPGGKLVIGAYPGHGGELPLTLILAPNNDFETARSLVEASRQAPQPTAAASLRPLSAINRMATADPRLVAESGVVRAVFGVPQGQQFQPSVSSKTYLVSHGQIAASGTTDAEGAVTFNGVKPGVYTLVFSGQGGEIICGVEVVENSNVATSAASALTLASFKQPAPAGDGVLFVPAEGTIVGPPPPPEEEQPLVGGGGFGGGGAGGGGGGGLGSGGLLGLAGLGLGAAALGIALDDDDHDHRVVSPTK